MIPAEYYYTIYLIIVTLVTFIYISPYNQVFVVPIKRNNSTTAFLFTVLMTLFIGFRPISGAYFGDMPGYALGMLDHRYEYIPVSWDNNYIFYPMMAFLSSHGASQRTPIVILAIINFGATFIAMKRLFQNDVMLAMLVFFGAFTSFGGMTNGLKAGCAAALFLVALAYRDKKIICLIFLGLSLGFHHSMQMPIAAFVICSLYDNTKAYVVFWVICLALAAAHITYFMGLFEGVVDEQGASYLNMENIEAYEGKKGFRLDFILYSAAPLVIGYYAPKRERIISDEYRFLINLYLLVNGIWLLCMYAQFTNRIASLSWILYPVLIIYPFMKGEWRGNGSKMLYYVTLGHLSFTLLMYFISLIN